MTALRVVGWNIDRPGASRSSEIAAAAGMLDADIVLFTEWVPTPQATLPKLMSKLGWPHQAFVHTNVLDNCEAKRSGVLATSRVPLKTCATNGPRNAAASWLELNVPGWDITVVGIRVLSPTPRGYWEWLGAQSNRLKSSAALLLGDLNVPSQTAGSRTDPGLNRLLADGWRDLIVESAPDAPTFWSKSGRPGIRNDYVLASPGFPLPVTADVLQTAGTVRLSGPEFPRLSDHAAVVADVRQAGSI